MTAFLRYHPGGKKQLMRGAGKDCTALFEKVRLYTCACIVLNWPQVEQCSGMHALTELLDYVYTTTVPARGILGKVFQLYLHTVECEAISTSSVPTPLDWIMQSQRRGCFGLLVLGCVLNTLLNKVIQCQTSIPRLYMATYSFASS